MAAKKIQSAQMVLPAVLGKYEGECADANITNKNGLDITREVWENVFASEEYQEAIRLGWYIGYLGHPEDPNCMDFKNACIVMRSGRIDDNGKVYGEFDLIDTPVGQVVKAFQDAGVTFGISVRGAGDIVNNSVDPETFVFRGFDLVTFPAFPESIPTYTAVAASSDPETQAKYKKICASVASNLDEIDSVSTLDALQSQFAAQSEEYKAIEHKKKDISEALEDIQDEDDVYAEVMEQKVDAMTILYSEKIEECEHLRRELKASQEKMKTIEAAADRKLTNFRKVASSQLRAVKAANTEVSEGFEHKVSSLERSNLIYKQKIASAATESKRKDDVIASLRLKLAETVRETEGERSKAADLAASNEKLRKKIQASESLLKEYRDAYTQLYASAVGADSTRLSITSATSVEELKKMIGASVAESSTAQAFSEIPEEEDFEYEEDDDDSIITI